jgi:hypothetical protein
MQLEHSLVEEVHVGVEQALFALGDTAVAVHLVAHATHPIRERRLLIVNPHTKD